jgi:hypothetical protein
MQMNTAIEIVKKILGCRSRLDNTAKLFLLPKLRYYAVH